MVRNKAKVAVLTSSRADFGIYEPLLEELQKRDSIELTLVAFGSHLSRFHGHTLDQLNDKGFQNVITIPGLLLTDDEFSIVNSYGLVVINFAALWKQKQFDIVFCLGDRFEMNAAVQSGIPFGVNFAHIHGGESTYGAIDNMYRDQISIASKVHFTSTEKYSERVRSLKGSEDLIRTVGALGLDGISELVLPTKESLIRKFGFPNEPFTLSTVHPETLAGERNKDFSVTIAEAFEEISEDIYVVITMPNADTFGTLYRKAFQDLKLRVPERIHLVENLGRLNYFAAMKNAEFLIGNTSSAIIEAASFNKFAIDIGDRQKGRLTSGNVLQVSFIKEKIVEGVQILRNRGYYYGDNVYYKGGASELIMKTLLDYLSI